MKKKFAKLSRKAQKAAFAQMNKDCALYKKSKSGKRSKSRGSAKCKSAWGIKKRVSRKKRRRAKK